jgi:hypothetical protein
LKFFWIVTIISVVVGVIVFVIELHNLPALIDGSLDPKKGVATLQFFISIPILVIYGIIIRNLTKRDPVIPQKVFNSLLAILAISILAKSIGIVAASRFVQYQFSINYEFVDFMSRGVLWTVTWLVYFKRSKRVNAYYGQSGAVCT